MYLIYCALYIVHTVYCTIYSVHCTLYTIHYIQYYMHAILYTLHCTLYTLQYIVYTIWCSVQCTLHTVHCTITLANYVTKGVRYLLSHQSCVDLVSCAVAAVLLVEKPFWSTGLVYLDMVVCHVWQGQAMYWACIYLSVGEQSLLFFIFKYCNIII